MTVFPAVMEEEGGLVQCDNSLKQYCVLTALCVLYCRAFCMYVDNIRSSIQWVDTLLTQYSGVMTFLCRIYDERRLAEQQTNIAAFGA